MNALEEQFPEDGQAKVLENCGLGCIGTTTIERAKRVKKNAETLGDLAAGLNGQHIGGGKLKLEGSKIYAEYDRCYRGMVSKTKEKISSAYCNCSQGWFLELFEEVFQQPVKVELFGSIIS